MKRPFGNCWRRMAAAGVSLALMAAAVQADDDARYGIVRIKDTRSVARAQTPEPVPPAEEPPDATTSPVTPPAAGSATPAPALLPAGCGSCGAENGACCRRSEQAPLVFYNPPHATAEPYYQDWQPKFYTFGDARRQIDANNTWMSSHGTADTGYACWWTAQSRRYLARNRIKSERANGWWYDQAMQHRARNRQQSAHIDAHFAAKLQYFHPSGCGGEGTPPVGYYDMIYAADPQYYHPLDSQVYAAPETGIPMAVPLAPNVNYMMNYGSGMPSSRLTPVSQLIPPR